VSPEPRGSVGAHLGRETEFGVEEHVAAAELSSRGGRAQSHGTRVSAGVHLDREVRSGAEEHVVMPELNSARKQDPRARATWQHQSSPQQVGEVRGRGTRDGFRAHLCSEVWFEAIACVDARHAPYLDLELVCGVPGLQGVDKNKKKIIMRVRLILKKVKTLFFKSESEL
jgi:hypothetical protein